MDIAESNDVVAISDQAIWLKSGKHTNARLLQAPGVGRYPATSEVVLQLGEDGIYVDAEAPVDPVLAAATSWVTVGYLVAATGMSDSTVRRRLEGLVAKGQMETTGGGKRNDATRFRACLSSPSNPKGGADEDEPPRVLAKDDFEVDDAVAFRVPVCALSPTARGSGSLGSSIEPIQFDL